MTELYSNFPSRWERSQKGVRTVADWLCDEGYNVSIGYQELAENLEEAEDFVDDGDILILTDSKDFRVEVKWLEATAFTGLEDYPWFEFMICETRSFNKCNPKPDYYIILEKFERAISIIDVKATKKYWYWKRKVDGSRIEDGKRPYYYCALKYVKWYRLK